eukprot:6174029-Pleurochrysis_carterae.AAC.4
MCHTVACDVRAASLRACNAHVHLGQDATGSHCLHPLTVFAPRGSACACSIVYASRQIGQGGSEGECTHAVQTCTHCSHDVHCLQVRARTSCAA